MKKRKSTKKARPSSSNRQKKLTEKKFDVLVLATMSAGKTSFINALIGQELLHTANEATTACITSIEHRPGGEHFSGICYSHANQELASHQNISPALARDWNANADVKRISLSGNFKAMPSPAPGLVLHDTPGPNNSQDVQHAELMLEAVRTVPFKALCYLLNASQLGTQDDRNFLMQLRDELEAHSSLPIYFILNKVDLLDPEKGEDIGAYVRKSHVYLTTIGFKEPVIIPTMANAALYARKALKEEAMTRSQRLSLYQELDAITERKQSLLQATTAPTGIKKEVLETVDRLERQHHAVGFDEQARVSNALQQLITISGIGTVEALIKCQRRSA